MKCTSSLVLAWIATLVTVSRQTSPSPASASPITVKDGTPYVQVSVPGAASCVLDSAHCTSWLYTDSSETKLDQTAYKFPWRGSLWSGERKVTYIDGTYYTYRGGQSRKDIVLGGKTLRLPTIGSMIKTNVTTNSLNPSLAGGFGIGLGRAVGGACCSSLVDSLKHFTLFLTNAQVPSGSAWPAGWYSVKLNDFPEDLYTGDPIAWKLEREASTGATTTLMDSVCLYDRWREECFDNDDAKLVLNIKEGPTYFPYPIFETILKELLDDNSPQIPYTIFQLSPGVYGVEADFSQETPKQDLVLKIAGDSSILIDRSYLFEDYFGANCKGYFVGYKLNELPVDQAKEIGQYGANAVFLGSTFLTNYALEHTFSCPVSFRMQQFNLS